MVRFARLAAALAVAAFAMAPPIATATEILTEPVYVTVDYGVAPLMLGKFLITLALTVAVFAALAVGIGKLARRRDWPGAANGDSKKWRPLRRSLLDAQPKPFMRC